MIFPGRCELPLSLRKADGHDTGVVQEEHCFTRTGYLHAYGLFYDIINKLSRGSCSNVEVFFCYFETMGTDK